MISCQMTLKEKIPIQICWYFHWRLRELNQAKALAVMIQMNKRRGNGYARMCRIPALQKPKKALFNPSRNNLKLYHQRSQGTTRRYEKYILLKVTKINCCRGVGVGYCRISETRSKVLKYITYSVTVLKERIKLQPNRTENSIFFKKSNLFRKTNFEFKRCF